MLENGVAGVEFEAGARWRISEHNDFHKIYYVWWITSF